ncbi:hypothetical protein [Enterovirga sp. CN4-39]|uniref:hypothetical protein n=1 Tax=Enterovirga sp. CN4-39 TaxID=3400910 RepID=UPI003C03CCD7
MARRTTKSNAGREGVTVSARATGQTSDQKPKRGRKPKAAGGFAPAETPEEAARIAQEERAEAEAGHPSAGPTPEDLADGPKTAFRPQETAREAQQIAREERAEAEAGHPSAGPTPDDLKGTSFEPIEEEPPILTGAAPSAGPTPEDLEQTPSIPEQMKNRAVEIAERRARATQPGGVDDVGSLAERKA